MRRYGQITAVLVAAVTLALGVATPALAGGRKSTASRGTLALVVLSDPTSVVAHYGDDVTFTVSTDATDKPYVNLRCYQNGAFVYDGWAGFFDGAWFGTTFTLTSSYWHSGAADCTADLIGYASNGRSRTLATVAFPVEA